MSHLEQIAQLIEAEDAFLCDQYDRLEELDAGREGNPGLECIYAGLFAAQEAAERAMKALYKLHNDITELLAGRETRGFAGLPVHRREAIAAYAVAVAHTRKPSIVFAACANRQLRRFVQHEAAAVLMDEQVPDDVVLSYMEHLAVTMPALICTSVHTQVDDGPKWGERALYAAAGAIAKTAWDKR